MDHTRSIGVRPSVVCTSKGEAGAVETVPEEKRRSCLGNKYLDGSLVHAVWRDLRL